MQAESMQQVEEQAKRKMDNALAPLQRDFNTIHAGRVSAALLDSIKADYYGVPTPISQIGTIATPEPQMLTINPWEKSMLKEIERAILKANLGLSVSNDGNIIRAVMPPLTEERRKELVKVIKKMGEDCKVAIRGVRRDCNEQLKKLEKEKVVSQDEEKAALNEIQKLTDHHITTVTEATNKKEAELMTL